MSANSPVTCYSLARDGQTHLQQLTILWVVAKDLAGFTLVDPTVQV
jgi:hypothetical protein